MVARSLCGAGGCHLPGVREENIFRGGSSGCAGVTYLVSAAVCVGLYYGMGGMNLFADMSHAGLAAAGIGFAVTGLEVGCVCMYKEGWAMNVGFILYTAMIVVALLAVGAVFYNEAVSFTAMAGIILTSSGMYMIVRGA